MLLPLPKTIIGSFNAPKSISYLHNMYDHQGVLVGREPFVRASYRHVVEGVPTEYPADCFALIPSKNDDAIYFITRDATIPTTNRSFWKWSLVGNRTTTGELLDTKSQNNSPFDMPYPKWARGFTGIAVCFGKNNSGTAAKGNYFIDYATDSVTTLTDADLPECRDVAYVGGRYVWLAYDGETIHYSEVNDAGNIGSLSFFDAELNIDRNKALANVAGDLFVFGRSSIQRFRNAGGSTQPFVNVGNSAIPIGGVGGYIKMPSKVVFVGQEEGGSFGVYEMSGSAINKISSSAVDELIALESLTYNDNESPTVDNAVDKMNSIEGQYFASYGVNIYTFTFNNFTLYARQSAAGYQWGFLSSDSEGDYSEAGDWNKKALGSSSANYLPKLQYKFSCFANNEWYFANNAGATACISKLEQPGSSETYYDTNVGGDVARIQRGVYLGLRDDLDRDTTFNSLEVSYSRRVGADYMTQYTGASGNTLDLTLSLTGSDSDWTTDKSIDFAALGETQRLRFSYTGGIVPTNGFMALCVKTDAKVPVTIEKLIANV